MGLCFQVQHIVHPLTHPRFGGMSRARVQWYAHQWSFLDQLCEHMQWTRLPWFEPGEVDEETADSYCCSWSRYIQFLSYAEVLAEQALQSYGDTVLHVTDRQDSHYAAIYVPVAFPRPIKIHHDPEWETITVGSSVHMSEVLEAMMPYTSGGPHSDIPGYTQQELESIEEIREALFSLARESLSRNLPIIARW